MMESKIDRQELEKIAKDAEARREPRMRVPKKQSNPKKDEEKQEIAKIAQAIVDSIPAALKKAAKHPKRTAEGLCIIAKIPIVCERLGSNLYSGGGFAFLGDQEALILGAVRELLKSTVIDGVTVEIKDRRELHHFWPNNDDQDFFDGYCKHYYIEAKTIVDK